LVRGLYQWLIDNGATPYILVSVDYEGVQVPPDYVSENNQIILNVSPTAAQGLTLGDTEVTFSARFNGQPMDVIVPVVAILAIYAKENGQGMIFGQEPGGDLPPPTEPEPEPEKPARSHLRVVK
jgi:stringent starvation protein B